MRTLLNAAAIAAGLALSAAGTASAANVIQLTDFYGKWSDADMSSGGSPSYTGNSGALGSHNATASWGTSTGYGKSSYNFKSSGNVNIDVPDDLGDTFVLGAFTHNNYPITGSSLESITLTLNTTVKVDGVSQGPLSLIYNFAHTETPNEARPCAFGGMPGSGINKYGCADKVEMNFISTSNLIQIGTNYYNLGLAGFVADDDWGSDPVTEFITKEKKANKAYLIGQLTFSHSDIPAVPEPATWAMMIGGFAATGAMLRRRNKNAALA